MLNRPQPFSGVETANGVDGIAGGRPVSLLSIAAWSRGGCSGLRLVAVAVRRDLLDLFQDRLHAGRAFESLRRQGIADSSAEKQAPSVVSAAGFVPRTDRADTPRMQAAYLATPLASSNRLGKGPKDHRGGRTACAANGAESLLSAPAHNDHAMRSSRSGRRTANCRASGLRDDAQTLHRPAYASSKDGGRYSARSARFGHGSLRDQDSQVSHHRITCWVRESPAVTAPRRSPVRAVGRLLILCRRHGTEPDCPQVSVAGRRRFTWNTNVKHAALVHSTACAVFQAVGRNAHFH